MSKWADAISKPQCIRGTLWDGTIHLATKERGLSRLNAEAVAPFAGTAWYRKHSHSSTPSPTKQLRTVQSLRAILIDCY